MAKLIYAALCSLDGYTEDEAGGFGWAAPSAELHAFVNDLERPMGVHLYGRRMYETMVFWETADLDGQPAEFRDYAGIWRAAEKVVYSRTLETATSARTRIEREFDAGAVQAMKDAAGSDLSIGGPGIAAAAFAAGLVDECHLFLSPVVVGGGKRALPAGVYLDLELLGERRFEGGVVQLHYEVR
ncbi:MAG TPA: dihydrofolate reductase family protein [Solirubrobacterales bacterium]|nr:dihydrofolate reductase family protein [Solirubrobacterales bacterium]